jgi:hypothetical protein
MNIWRFPLLNLAKLKDISIKKNEKQEHNKLSYRKKPWQRFGWTAFLVDSLSYSPPIRILLKGDEVGFGAFRDF